MNIVLLMFALPALAQSGGTVTVSGVVTSAEDKYPLIGAHVIAGDNNGVSTLLDGSYSIDVKPGDVLTYYYVGYEEVKYTVPDGAASIKHNVELKAETKSLEDVVVIAYGVRKKGTIAGSVSTVKAEKIENTPTAAFDQALQGQVPGLTVLSSSGEPSVAATLSIRGTNSINSGTAPLYILDGAAISSADFNTINPADIESISVLKDASSTSIYGARAANGVVVITTKRGRMASKPSITYRMQLGFSQLTQNNWDLMNTAERIQYEKEIGLTSGKNYDLLGKTDVNWLDAVYNNAALLQNYELSVSGASDRTNYYISGGYYNQDGIAVGSYFDRYSLRANVEQRAADWLKIGTNTMLNYQGIEQADEGSYTLVTPISAARFMLPYWNPYRPDGSIASIDDGTWKGDGQNPLEWLEKNRREYKKYKLVSNIFAEATPVEGLTIRSQFSIDYSHMTGFGTSTPSYGPNLGEGSAQRISTDGMSLSVTNTVNYQFRKGDKHSFNFLMGQEGVDYHYEDFSILTEGQNNDRLVNISTGTRASSWSDTTDDDYGYLSFFGRGEYNYDNRYYADFSVRTDASSRFGADRRWAGFWSVSFMWNLRQERFMDNASRWLTNAQIAVSTGTSGNSSIPNYEHLALVSGGSDYFGNAGIAPSQPGSDNLGWEKLWTTNLAFHLGFWNRLNVDLEFYNKRTSDMLMLVPESYANKGYGYSWDNIGVMVNRGFELNVTGTIFSNRNFMWSVNANVSYNRNRILELYNGVQEYEVSKTAIEGEDGAYQIMVNGLFTEENIDGGVGIIDFYDANIDNTEDPGNNAHNRYCVTMPAFRDLVKHDANNAVFAFNAEGQYSSTTAGTEVVDDYATAGVSSTAGLKFFVLMPDGYGGYYAAKEKTGWVTVTDDMWDENGEIFQHRDYTIAVTANSGAARSAVLVALPQTLAAEIDENGDLDAQLLKADGSYDLKDEYKPYAFATVEQDAPASGSGDEGLSVICPTDVTTQYYLDNGFFKFEELTRRAELHLWYAVRFGKEFTVDEVISRLSQLGEVQTATPNRVIKRAYREDRKAYPVSQRMLERSSVTRVSGDYAYNDVLLPWQWHIINRGYRDNFVIGETDGKTVEEVQAKYRAGADVNCEKAWERTTGDPSIVVAVLDEGIYWRHPDLVNNMWENEDEPYYSDAAGEHVRMRIATATDMRETISVTTSSTIRV